MLIFGIIAFLTISNISQVFSKDLLGKLDDSDLIYGGIRFTTANGDVQCRGILFTKEWIVVDPKCKQNAQKIHITKINRRTVSIDVDIEEAHLTTDPDNPQEHHFELMKTTKPVTDQEFNYLPVDGTHTWENVRKAAENFCSNPTICTIINRVISKKTGVSYKICSQSFGA